MKILLKKKVSFPLTQALVHRDGLGTRMALGMANISADTRQEKEVMRIKAFNLPEASMNRDFTNWITNILRQYLLGKSVLCCGQ